MSCSCSDDEKKDVGPLRVVRTTTAPLVPSESDSEEGSPENAKETPEASLPRRLVKFM